MSLRTRATLEVIRERATSLGMETDSSLSQEISPSMLCSHPSLTRLLETNSQSNQLHHKVQQLTCKLLSLSGERNSEFLHLLSRWQLTKGLLLTSLLTSKRSLEKRDPIVRPNLQLLTSGVMSAMRPLGRLSISFTLMTTNGFSTGLRTGIPLAQRLLKSLSWQSNTSLIVFPRHVRFT